MVQLGVNIDHVATLRQARRGSEPDPVWAAVEAQLGGADGITMHLREDRRHIQDHDLRRIKQSCEVKLNLEMAATDEMVQIACDLMPHLAMLVPEGRMEITTEGGLDVVAGMDHIKQAVKKLHDHGLVVSAFVDAQVAQIEAAAEAGFDVCEVHTGPYAHAFADAGGDTDHSVVSAELLKVAETGSRIRDAGMRFNAGHALNYLNVMPIASQEGIRELHIGHSIVSRAVFVGIRSAVSQMKHLITEPGRGPGGP